MSQFQCRLGCAACCIAPSISSALPLLPEGKPANVPCPHLDDELKCQLFNQPNRPAVCGQLTPCVEMCGKSSEEALAYLTELENVTAP